MEGLEKFREAFEAYSENYVIIGGTACDIEIGSTKCVSNQLGYVSHGEHGSFDPSKIITV